MSRIFCVKFNIVALATAYSWLSARRIIQNTKYYSRRCYGNRDSTAGQQLSLGFAVQCEQ